MSNLKRDIVEKFKETDELEIRVIINKDKWYLLYKSWEDTSLLDKVEQSITIYFKDKSNIRQEIYFENGVKTEEKFIKKTKIAKMKLFNTVISLASEEEMNKQSLNNISHIRLRLRSSLILPQDINDWRIDFTFVKSLDSSQVQSLTKYKNSMFPKNVEMNSKNFLDVIDKIQEDSNFKNNVSKTFELEFEYIGNRCNQKRNFVSCLLSSINDVIKFIQNDNNEYNQTLFEVAKIIFEYQDNAGKNISKKYRYKQNLKQMLNNPVPLNIRNYKEVVLPNVNSYFLTDKADGERVLLWISDKVILFMTSKYIDITDKLIEGNFNKSYFNGNTFLDCEVIGLNNNSFDMIYAFDVLFVNNKRLTTEDFEKRNDELENICKNTGKYVQKKIMKRLTTENYKTIIDEIYNRFRIYTIDGLIFTPATINSNRIFYNVRENYFDCLNFKWKPPEHLTIDFLVMKIPMNLIGVKPYLPKKGYDIYFLFCGISQNQFKNQNIEYVSEYRNIFEGYKLNQYYFPIQFCPSENPKAYIYYHPIDFELDGIKISENELHGHVVEFGYFNNSWIIKKLRTDRDSNVEKGIGYGNDFKVAEDVFNSILNPFTFNMLLSVVGSSEKAYFASKKTMIYRPITKFNAFVKAQMIRQLENAEFVIDLASGKGQDLFVYNGFKIKNLLCIDNDKDALDELNHRKYKLNDDAFYVLTPKPEQNLTLYTKNIDLTQSYKTILDEIHSNPKIPEKVNGVVINFALHYLISDEKSLNNFVKLVSQLLGEGGIFIFTCFNGKIIFDALKNKESLDLYDNSTLKFSIKKDYKSEKFSSFGLKISVLHPFSNGEYYQENILDINLIIEKFKENGFIARQNNSFGNMLDKYKEFNDKMYGLMTQNDKLYASLYSYVSLIKL